MRPRPGDERSASAYAAQRPRQSEPGPQLPGSCRRGAPAARRAGVARRGRRDRDGRRGTARGAGSPATRLRHRRAAASSALRPAPHRRSVPVEVRTRLAALVRAGARRLGPDARGGRRDPRVASEDRAHRGRRRARRSAVDARRAVAGARRPRAAAACGRAAPAEPLPLARARAQLELGSRLRRDGERTLAREHLYAALEYAVAERCEPIEVRAAEELRIMGGARASSCAQASSRSRAPSSASRAWPPRG